MRVKIIEPTKQVHNRKKKVCAYARVSTDTEKQAESLGNQIQYYENIITSNPDYEYVGVFADRGIKQGQQTIDQSLKECWSYVWRGK